MSMRAAITVLALVTSALAGALISRAGPLDPPAGPVTATYKTLSEIEPRTAINATNTPGDADSVFKITKSGSYYLVGDVAVQPGRKGIEVDQNTAPDVTIDLNGFTMRGAAGSKNGIESLGSGRMQISDGAFSGFGLDTVILSGGEYRIEKLTISNGAASGMYLGGSGQITDCYITNCGDAAIRCLSSANIERCLVWGGHDGISLAPDSVVVQSQVLGTLGTGFVVSESTLRNCVASGNARMGFELGYRDTVSGCVADRNHLQGFAGGLGGTLDGDTAGGNYLEGFSLGDQCVLRGCTSRENGSVGFRLAVACSLDDCSSIGNSGHGFESQEQATYVNCRSSQSYLTGDGFNTGARSVFTGCSATLNTGNGMVAADYLGATGCTQSGNSGDGLRAAANCRIENCSASNNSGDGFELSDGGHVQGCSASGNGQRGINANNGCKIAGCLTRNNLSDGIFVNYSCEITDNNCNGDGVAAGTQGGIHAVGQANRIDSNNISYADRGIMIDAGGSVIIRNTVKGCTVNYSVSAGNSDAQVLTPGAAFTATNPWANFSF